MNKLLVIFVFLVSFLIAETPSHALTIPASEDTTGYGNQITALSNSASTLLVDPLRTAFLYFDLNDIPSDTQVRWAKLRLFIPSVRSRGAGLELHLVTGEWNEALKSNQPTISTGTLGIIEPEKLAARRFVTVDVTDTVQGWINRSISNEGFAVKPIIKTGTAAASVYLTSKEGPSLGLPAELDIEFEPETKPITSDQLPASLSDTLTSLKQTSAALKAFLTPSITSQPILNLNGSISAAAQGIGNLTYQWYQDGVAVVGGTSASLPMHGLISGTYTFKASNGFESATSVEMYVSRSSVLVPIPGGTYTIGNRSEDDSTGTSNIWTVTLSPYSIAANDTTKAEWDVVRSWALTRGYTDLAVGAGKASNHPVQTVSWYDAIKWLNAASEKEGLTPCYLVRGAIYKKGQEDAVTCDWNANGYRLPTEAEWEVAARGNLTGKRFPWGDTASPSQANYASLENEGLNNPTYATGAKPFTSPVGSFPANGYGLYDMAGNVYQWCWDWFGFPAVGGSDPQGFSEGLYRVLKGGAWEFGETNMMCGKRFYTNDFRPSFASYSIGFRIARSSKIASGLVAYYPFNGDAKDASGNGNDGILHGSPSLTTDHLGRPNRAYSFDGVKDYIEIGKPLGQSPQDFSEAAWVKIIAAGNNIDGHSAIFAQRESAYSWGRLLSIETNVMKASLAVDGPWRINGVQSATQFQFGVWMHVCGVRRGATHEIYVNGVLEGSLQDDSPYDSIDNLHLMHHSAWNVFTNGCLEGVRIYNRALSAKDVAALYNSGK